MSPIIVLLMTVMSFCAHAQDIVWPSVCDESACPRIPGVLNYTATSWPPVVVYSYAASMSNAPHAIQEYFKNTCSTTKVTLLSVTSTVSTIQTVTTLTNATTNTSTTETMKAHVYEKNPSDYIILNATGYDQLNNFSRVIISNNDYNVAYTCIDIESKCHQIWFVSGLSQTIPSGEPWKHEIRQLGGSVKSDCIYNFSPSCYT